MNIFIYYTFLVLLLFFILLFSGKTSDVVITDLGISVSNFSNTIFNYYLIWNNNIYKLYKYLNYNYDINI